MRRARSRRRSRTCARSSVERGADHLALDTATRRNLEITETLRGEPAPTLYSLLDGCATGAGSRLLRAWLTNPLRAQAAAAARHEAIAELSAALQPRTALRSALKATVDIERIASRIALRSARPRDLAGLRDTLQRLPALAAAIAEPTSPLLNDAADALAVDPRWAELLERAIAAEPAAAVREGNVIAAGYDADLDELRAIQDHCGAFLVDLEARERERTGIASLKVEYNRVHGFYIEVTNANVQRIPDDYRRRQTMKNAERYITPELKTFEDKALSAQERALARERRLFEEIVIALGPAIPALQRAAIALASLDVFATHAEQATALRWTRPRFSTEAMLAITRRPPSGGRRPGRAFHSERPGARCGAAHADRHRAQHGRQIDVYAADRGDRAAGVLRPVRTRPERRDRCARRHPYAHRRRRRPGGWPLHVHGRDDRGRLHTQPGDAEQPGPDR